MLLIQASEANSESSQVYKMGTLAKIVNGLKLVLKLVRWGALRTHIGSICLNTWISDTSDSADLKTKKSQFVSYLSIAWIMTHCIQVNSRILSITRIIFAYASRNPMSSRKSNVQAARVNGCSN